MNNKPLLATRRRAAGSVVAAIVAPFVNRGRYAIFGQSARSYSERAVRLVRESLVIDLLNQFAYRQDQQAKFRLWFTKPGAFTAAEWQPFKEWGINAISIGQGAATYEQGIRLMATWNGFIAQYPDWLLRIGSAADFVKAKSTGRLGIVIGFQNGAHFRMPVDVDTFLGLGQRISQLTYNSRNLLGSGAYEPQDDGLTDLGNRIVVRMNEVGMAVDCAHAGDRTMLETISLAKRPPIISHGNCRALNPRYRRCIPNEAITALANKGGVMGVTVIAPMAKWPESNPPATVDDVIDHYDHIRRLVGIEHVGLGTDIGLEGNDLGDPEALRRLTARIAEERKEPQASREAAVGLDHAKRVYDLTEGFIRRKYTDAHIQAILGENWRRVLTEVWAA